MATFTRSAKQFQEAVSKGLTGVSILAVTSEPGLGSLFHLGRWVPRQHTIENPALPDRLRSFQGSKSLNVRCLWELSSNLDLVPSDAPLVGQSARMKLLDALEGKTIVSVLFDGSSLGMELEVQRGLSLKLLTNGRGFGLGGYTVGLEDKYWSTYADGTVTLWTDPE